MFNVLIPRFIADNYKKNLKKGRFSGIAMFVDIVGFTSMTQDLIKHGKEGAEELSELINHIFKPAFNEIYNQSGWIASFAGDSFTAIFPKSHANDAIRTAYFIQQKLKDLTLTFKNLKFKLNVRLG